MRRPTRFEASRMQAGRCSLVPCDPGAISTPLSGHIGGDPASRQPNRLLRSPSHSSLREMMESLQSRQMNAKAQPTSGFPGRVGWNIPYPRLPRCPPPNGDRTRDADSLASANRNIRARALGSHGFSGGELVTDASVGATVEPSTAYQYCDRRFPWRCVGQLRGPGGDARTAWMVGRRVFVTAAHSVRNVGGATADYRFSAGDCNVPDPTLSDFSNAGLTPFRNAFRFSRVAMGFGANLFFWFDDGRGLLGGAGDFPQDWTAYDFAVGVLEDPIGDDTGWLPVHTIPDAWVGAPLFQSLGYGGEFWPMPRFHDDVTVELTQSLTAEVTLSSYLFDLETVSRTAVMYDSNTITSGGDCGGPLWSHRYLGDGPAPHEILTASVPGLLEGAQNPNEFFTGTGPPWLAGNWEQPVPDWFWFAPILPFVYGSNSRGSGIGAGGPALQQLVNIIREEFD